MSLFGNVMFAMIGGPLIGLGICAAIEFPGTVAVIVAVALSPFIGAFIYGLATAASEQSDWQRRDDEKRKADTERRVLDMLRPR